MKKAGPRRWSNPIYTAIYLEITAVQVLPGHGDLLATRFSEYGYYARVRDFLYPNFMLDCHHGHQYHLVVAVTVISARTNANVSHARSARLPLPGSLALGAHKASSMRTSSK
jgi:hypothetical protein